MSWRIVTGIGVYIVIGFWVMIRAYTAPGKDCKKGIDFTTGDIIPLIFPGVAFWPLFIFGTPSGGKVLVRGRTWQ